MPSGARKRKAAKMRREKVTSSNNSEETGQLVSNITTCEDGQVNDVPKNHEERESDGSSADATSPRYIPQLALGEDSQAPNENPSSSFVDCEGQALEEKHQQSDSSEVLKESKHDSFPIAGEEAPNENPQQSSPRGNESLHLHHVNDDAKSPRESPEQEEKECQESHHVPLTACDEDNASTWTLQELIPSDHDKGSEDSPYMPPPFDDNEKTSDNDSQELTPNVQQKETGKSCNQVLEGVVDESSDRQDSESNKNSMHILDRDMGKSFGENPTDVFMHRYASKESNNIPHQLCSEQTQQNDEYGRGHQEPLNVPESHPVFSMPLHPIPEVEKNVVVSSRVWDTPAMPEKGEDTGSSIYVPAADSPVDLSHVCKSKHRNGAERDEAQEISVKTDDEVVKDIPATAAPGLAQRTSWMNCCGLLDLFNKK